MSRHSRTIFGALVALVFTTMARADELDEQAAPWLVRKFGLIGVAPDSVDEVVNRGANPQVTRVAFDGGYLHVTSAWHRVHFVWERADGSVVQSTLWEHRWYQLTADVAVTEEADGVVRVAIRVVERGPVTLTTAWDDIFVPTTRDRPALHVRVVTGINVSSKSLVAGWERAVVIEGASADPSGGRSGGLRIVEVDGPLAWFRPTGTWDWAELEGVVSRARRHAARAFALEAKTRAVPSPDPYAIDVTLVLLPGLIEPVNRAWLDDYRVIGVDTRPRPATSPR